MSVDDGISGEMLEADLDLNDPEIISEYFPNFNDFSDEDFNSSPNYFISEGEDKKLVQNQDQGVQRSSESLQTPDISVQQPLFSQIPDANTQEISYVEQPSQSCQIPDPSIPKPLHSGVLDQTPGLIVQQTSGKSVQQTPQSVQQTSGQSVQHQSSQYYQIPGKQSAISRTATHPVGDNTGNSVLQILSPQQTPDNVPHIAATHNPNNRLQNNLLQSETPTQKQTNTGIVVSYSLGGIQNRYDIMEDKPETGTSHMKKNSAISHNGEDISGPTSSSHNQSKRKCVSSSHNAVTKKPKLHEITEPLADPEKEQSRLRAIKQREYREHAKQEKENLKREVETLKEEKRRADETVSRMISEREMMETMQQQFKEQVAEYRNRCQELENKNYKITEDHLRVLLERDLLKKDLESRNADNNNLMEIIFGQKNIS